MKKNAKLAPLQTPLPPPHPFSLTQTIASVKQHLSAGESGGGLVTLRWGKSAKSMKKNAKLAPSQTPLRQVAIFLHNADFPHLRVTKLPPDSPAERCCFALAIGCVRENG